MMFKSKLKQILIHLDKALMRVAVSSQILSSIYWMMISIAGGKSFGREHQSVIAGRLKYYDSLKSPYLSSSLLRRNIHRLEKGIIMQPRRTPFGLDYIEETVHAFSDAVKSGVHWSELKWSRDVLSKYFSINESCSELDSAKNLFENISISSSGISNEAKKYIPYVRNENDRPNIDFEQFFDLVTYRRSVRWYQRRPVARDIIERAVIAASYSPTACNRMPYEFRIFDEPSLVEKVMKVPGGTSGFSHQVPAVAVIVGKQRNYFGQHDRHCIYTDASLAAMSFVYALEIQGVGSCCINWPDIEKQEKTFDSLLSLELDERPIMLISFGWPDPEGMVACSTKKSVDVLCRFN